MNNLHPTDKQTSEKLSKEIESLDKDDQNAVTGVFGVLDSVDFLTIMDFITCFNSPKLRKLVIKALTIRAGYLFKKVTSASPEPE